MALKKRNNFSINFTDKNLMFLQNLGYLDHNKKSNKRLNLSEFINRCVDNFLAIEKPEQNHELECRLIVSNITQLEKRRNAIEIEMKGQAQRLAALRATLEPIQSNHYGLPRDEYENGITMLQLDPIKN